MSDDHLETSRPVGRARNDGVPRGNAGAPIRDKIAAGTDNNNPAPRDERKDRPGEIGGRPGPDPTRYGDWEKAGRCIDF